MMMMIIASLNCQSMNLHNFALSRSLPSSQWSSDDDFVSHHHNPPHDHPVFGCSAGISIGSEMSGGVSNVTVEKVLVWDSRRGVRIKTAPGRGGYVRDITYRGVELLNLRVGIVVKTDYNEHPDEGFDPSAVPAVERIAFEGIRGKGVRVAVRIQGSAEIPVRSVTFRDLAVGLAYKKKHVFQCAFVQGRVLGSVFPAPCPNLDQYDERGRLIRPSSVPNTTDVDYDV